MSPTVAAALDRVHAGESFDVFVTPREMVELSALADVTVVVSAAQPGVTITGEEGGWWCWVSLTPAA